MDNSRFLFPFPFKNMCSYFQVTPNLSSGAHSECTVKWNPTGRGVRPGSMETHESCHGHIPELCLNVQISNLSLNG